MTKRLAFVLLVIAGLAAACDRATGPAEENSQAGSEAAADSVAEPATDSIPAPDNVAAVPDDAERSESGLAWQVLKPGNGTRHPEATSRVEVHYSGWTTDGEMFDSSRVRGATAVFPLNRVIAGWTEGVQLMVEGEQRRFWIPPELAYANSTRPGAPQGMLVFDVELIAIKD